MLKELIKQIIFMFFMVSLVLAYANCNGLTDLSGKTSSVSTSSSTAASSDESDAEAAYSSAVEMLVDSSNSSSAGSSSMGLTTSYLTTSSVSTLKHYYRCDDLNSVTESYSCDNTDGSVTRTVTFEDCELTNSYRDVVLNGTFQNTVQDGGEGLCNFGNSFDFSVMVMGRDGSDATHQHTTDFDEHDEGIAATFENFRGDEVTVTKTATRSVTFTDPVDEDEDGAAESVIGTVDRDAHFVHTIDDEITHDVTVLTTDDDFVSYSEDGTASTIEVSMPVHEITFDEDGTYEGRTITSGNLIVDHNLAGIRLVFGVGDEALAFERGTCGPVSGDMTVIGYAINDDGTIGEAVGSGEINFADGDVKSASFDGTALNIRPRPCY